jgi:hypothetical protein
MANVDNDLRLRLQRFEDGDQGTFGTLVVPDDGTNYYFYTGELPWRDNKPRISCIPVGIYSCKLVDRRESHFKKWLYNVQDVKGRSGILIHSANFMGDKEKGYKKQLEGCIALGDKLGFMDGQRAVLLSTPAIRRFETLMNGRDFTLEITQ